VEVGALISELKRRRVFRALVGYGIAAFAVLQIIEPIMHGLRWPDEVLGYVVAALAAGFPVVMYVAWVFDVRREGEPAAQVGGSRRVRVLVLLAALGLLSAAPGLIYWFAIRRPPATTSIAVLPLDDLSPEGNQGYFADGLAEELLETLAKIPGLRVAGRTSSFSFKGKKAAAAVIGRELGVTALVEGSVRKAGDRVRVTVQLLDAAEGFHLWSQTYDRKLADVFALQDEVARSVAEALRVKLMPSALGAQPPRRTVDLRCFEEYTAGRAAYFELTESGYRRAVDAFKRALEIDPTYAPAWAGMALAEHILSYNWMASEAEEAATVAHAREAADRAIALWPELPEGYVARAYLRATRDWDWEGALADSDRALALRPDHPEALSARARWLLAPLHRYSEAEAVAGRSTEVDPLNARFWTYAAAIDMFAGRYDKARSKTRRALQISPKAVFPPFVLGLIALYEKKPSDALAIASNVPLPGRWRLLLEADARWSLGQKEASDAALETLVRTHAHDGANIVAAVYAWRNDRDRAFEWLDRAMARREVDLVDLPLDTYWANITGDPRWPALLARLRLPAK
jgi:serine/threonine-protein kinase